MATKLVVANTYILKQKNPRQKKKKNSHSFKATHRRQYFRNRLIRVDCMVPISDSWNSIE